MIQTVPQQLLKTYILTKEVPPYPDPRIKPPPRLPGLKENWRTLTESDIDINTGFEDSSPYEEGIIQNHMKDQISPISKN